MAEDGIKTSEWKASLMGNVIALVLAVAGLVVYFTGGNEWITLACEVMAGLTGGTVNGTYIRGRVQTKIAKGRDV